MILSMNLINTIININYYKLLYYLKLKTYDINTNINNNNCTNHLYLKFNYHKYYTKQNPT